MLFREGHVRPALKDRLLAVAVAFALHASAIALAAAMLEGRWAPLSPHAPVDRPTRIRFLVLPGREPLPDSGQGAALGRPKSEVRHARPAPVEATFIPGAEKVEVDEGPGAQTIHPDLPPVIIDEGPRTRSPRAEFAAAIPPAGNPDGEPLRPAGDSARRGPPVGERTPWMLMGVSWSTVTEPRPSRFCVPRAPAMPESARIAGITGSVEAVYEVSDDGIVRSESLEGQPLLASAVRAWLHGCLFEPSLHNGRRAAARVHQTFDFVLR